MSCINPMAPLGETAQEQKFDSALMTALIRVGGSRWAWAASAMRGSRAAGAVAPPVGTFGTAAIGGGFIANL